MRWRISPDRTGRRAGLFAALGATLAVVYLLWPRSTPDYSSASQPSVPPASVRPPVPQSAPTTDSVGDSAQAPKSSLQTKQVVRDRLPTSVEPADLPPDMRPRMPWDHLEREGPILMCPLPDGIPQGADRDLSAVVFDRHGEGRKFIASVTYDAIFEAAAPPDASSGVLTYRGVAKYPFRWDASQAQQVVRCTFDEPVPYLEASGTVLGAPYEVEWVHGCMEKAAIVDDEFWMAIAVTEPCEIFVVAVGEDGNLYGPPLELGPGDLPSTDLVLRRP